MAESFRTDTNHVDGPDQGRPVALLHRTRPHRPAVGGPLGGIQRIAALRRVVRPVRAGPAVAVAGGLGGDRVLHRLVGVFFLTDIAPEGDAAERKRQWYEEVVYRSVLPLPTFLEFNTIRREPGREGPERAIQRLNEKCNNSVQTVSALLGFALLIVSFTLNLAVANRGMLSPFQQTLTTAILFVQVVAIVALVIGMDSLDTSMNRFIDVDDEERYRITRYYYRTGIYYYYRGLVVLIFSAVLSMMLLTPSSRSSASPCSRLWATTTGSGTPAATSPR